MFTGEQIRQKRKQQGMSAEDLANYLNVKKENLYKWERGHKPNNAEDYIKLENWLDGKLENVPQKTVSSGNIQTDSDPENDDKYLRLLEDNDRFFKDTFSSTLKQIAASLDALAVGQYSIQANVDIGFQYQIDREAGKNPVKAEEMKREYDKRYGARITELIGRGTGEGK